VNACDAAVTWRIDLFLVSIRLVSGTDQPHGDVGGQRFELAALEKIGSKDGFAWASVVGDPDRAVIEHSSAA